MIHTVKDFSIVNEAEVDAFLEFSCFFYDPTAIGNLISGSSALSESGLKFWSLARRILCITLLVCKMSAIVWQSEHSLALPLFGIGMKTDIFQSCGHCWVFQICWHIECSNFQASSFRICNSSAGILSPPLALFVVMLPFFFLLWCFLRPIWLHTPGCLPLGVWSHHCGYLGHEDLFCIVLLCILGTSSLNIFCFC